MNAVEQGDLLKIEGFRFPVIVVSNNFFNGSGKAVVCPILKSAVEGPLHIRLKNCPVEGFVSCEQMKYVDLSARRCAKLSQSRNFDIMDISDAVMGIFDYQTI